MAGNAAVPAAAGLVGGPVLLYMLFLASLTSPYIRRHMIFMHKFRWPLFPKFDNPEVYGYAPNRIRNMYLRTADGVCIGVWHTLPLSVSNRHSIADALPDSVFEEALRDPKYLVMMYMHGHGGNRAQGHRKNLARHISSDPLNMHFITFDYRGFGDSSDINPSEEGVVTDSRTVWNWLTQDMGVPASRIVLSGQSFGTGIACALAGRSLASEGIVPRALILTAPYTSIRDLLLTYKAGGVLPVLQPLRYLPCLHGCLSYFLDAPFDSLSSIRSIRCPILLIHSIEDKVIICDHSVKLFKHLCEDNTRTYAEADLVETQSIGQYARLDKLVLPREHLDVQYLEMHFGGHDLVEYSEIALQTIKNLIDRR